MIAEHSQRKRRRTLALLGPDGYVKTAVRRLILGKDCCDSEGPMNEQSSNIVWSSCCSDRSLTILEAPGHVDYLSFVDIALKVCASTILALPLLDDTQEPRPAEPLPVEMAAHWALHVEQVGRPMGVVLHASSFGSGPLREADVEKSFGKALDDIRQLGLRPVVLSAPAVDAAGNLSSLSALEAFSSSAKAAVYREQLRLDLMLPENADITTAVANATRRREVVPVVFVAAPSGGSGSTTTTLDELIGQILPSVGEAVDGTEAGTWQGLDMETGSSVEVLPRASEPFAGIAFQTTYLEKGAWKAFDLLVVRGTLRPGQQMVNATVGNGEVIRAERLEPGGGCCEGLDQELIDEACPGDVVRVTMPAEGGLPGTGGSLCWWCDPDTPIRLPVLHEQAYASIAGAYYTLAVGLEQVSSPSKQNALLGALARTIEQDQSLRIECADGTEVRLTACGSEQLRRLRRRLRMDFGLRLPLRPCQISCRSTLRRPLRVHARAYERTSSGGITALARCAPLARGTGVRVREPSAALMSQLAGDEGFEAFTRGVLRGCKKGFPVADHGDRGPRTVWLPLDDVEFELLALGRPAEGLWSIGQRCGADLLTLVGARCVQAVLEAAGKGSDSSRLPALRVLEPLTEVTVQVPKHHVHEVLSLLRSRGGEVQSICRLRPQLVSVEALLPQRDIRRLGQVLAERTRSTATFTTHDCPDYTVVADADEDLALAVAGGSEMRKAKGCPSWLWTQEP